MAHLAAVASSAGTAEFPGTVECYEEAISYARDCVKEKNGRVTLSILEEEIDRLGREFMRTLLEETLAKMPDAEAGLGVEGNDGVLRLHERSRARRIATKFGVVMLARKGFSAPEASSLMPKDAALNLPLNLYSFGVQKIVAGEICRGAFSEASRVIQRETGLEIHKRQLQEVAVDAAKDFEDFSLILHRRLRFNLSPVTSIHLLLSSIPQCT